MCRQIQTRETQKLLPKTGILRKLHDHVIPLERTGKLCTRTCLHSPIITRKSWNESSESGDPKGLSFCTRPTGNMFPCPPLLQKQAPSTTSPAPASSRSRLRPFNKHAPPPSQSGTLRCATRQGDQEQPPGTRSSARSPGRRLVRHRPLGISSKRNKKGGWERVRARAGPASELPRAGPASRLSSSPSPSPSPIPGPAAGMPSAPLAQTFTPGPGGAQTRRGTPWGEGVAAATSPKTVETKTLSAKWPGVPTPRPRGPAPGTWREPARPPQGCLPRPQAPAGCHRLRSRTLTSET